MPTGTIVDGVKIQFYPAEHPPPHFHAKIGEFIAQIGIDPVIILKGTLPPNKVNSVLDWARLHQAALFLAWNTMAAGRKPERIE